MTATSSPGVYIEELSSGMRLIAGVSTSITAFLGSFPWGPTEPDPEHPGDLAMESAKPTLVRSWREFTEKFPEEDDDSTAGEGERTPGRYTRFAVAGYFQNGGGPCYIVDVEDVDDTLGGLEDALTELEHIPDIKIIVVPDLMEGTAPPPAADPVPPHPVSGAVVDHCRKMGNRMAILHLGEDWTAEDALRVNLGLTDPAFAALYYPWVTVKDANGEDRAVPPSGHLAGVWGRVDASRGVHKAPANQALQGASGVQTALTDEEQGGLNDKGVNCLRVFPGQGIRVWGARTQDKGTDWRYINVRRLFNYLQESIRLGTNWAVFEPNDHRLWSSIHRNVSAFLLDLWRQGALLGRTRDQAFYVICDESNNPPEKLADGQVHCDIGVAAVRPAEFIVFRVTQVIGGPQDN
ncbi:phage tail sheath C-terminal domain-containing protein [Streptomyces lavendulae]|uniref:phage tail sheath family protein n=1 Tax=Streptomyces lavendulae TaxID=1914 RepID=UPI0033D0E64B